MIDDPTPYDTATDTSAEPGFDSNFQDGFQPEGVTTGFDLSGDGVNDIELTQFSDGSYYVVTDSDLDGAADSLSLDTSGDGLVDTQVIRTADGGYVLLQDLDGDGSFESQSDLTREELVDALPGAITLLDAHFSEVPSDLPTDPVDPVDVPTDPNDSPVNWVENGQLVGDPVGDSEHWFLQAQNGFCVPAVVAGIVGEYTGQDFADESHFVERANDLGLFVVGMDGVPGMMPEGALQLLDDAGVPAELTVGSVDSLGESLEEGRRVILFVDSGEIWYGEDTEDNTSDHVVSVTGIDYDRGVVIISDTGDPNGNMNEVPIDQFEDAWADSGFAMIQCDDPAPADSDVPVAPADAGDDTSVHAGAGVPEQFDTMTSWATEQPWALLPVVLNLASLSGAL